MRKTVPPDVNRSHCRTVFQSNGNEVHSMSILRSAIVVLVVGTVVSVAAQAQSDSPPSSCPVTTPPKPFFVPPTPYPATTSGGSFYFGTPKLWALVWKSPWRGLALWNEGYRQKIFWWSEGYDWKQDPQPALSVTGKRLDAPTAPLVSDDHADNGYRDDMRSFIVTGVNFPTIGCWQITGRFHGQVLSFVVWVDK